MITFTNKEILKFNSKYAVNKSGCWEWQVHKNKWGYGWFYVKKKERVAHRISYSIYIGEIPKGLLVCHKCDNPSCVNPFHLFLGTTMDNRLDMLNKGRHRIHSGALKKDSVAGYMAGCRCSECVLAEKNRSKRYVRDTKGKVIAKIPRKTVD